MLYVKVTKVLKDGTVTGTYGLSQSEHPNTFITTLSAYPQLDAKGIEFIVYIVPSYRANVQVKQSYNGNEFIINFVGLELV